MCKKLQSFQKDLDSRSKAKREDNDNNVAETFQPRNYSTRTVWALKTFLYGAEFSSSHPVAICPIFTCTL